MIALQLFAMTATFAIAEDVDQQSVGITKVPPTDVRFVRTKRGFMVPYQAKIPGTDITYEMVPVPAGRVVMGSPADEAGRKRDEGPQVPVRIDAFWMGKCEVTWGEYQEYMRLYDAFKRFNIAGIRRVNEDNEADAITAPTIIYDPDFRFEHGDHPRMPAVSMTQYGAKQYTQWLSGVTGRFYRLPSEAEWEYAARAGSKTAFHFGDADVELAKHAWYAGNADEKSHRVGGKLPNAWGLHDMHGNVCEWVLDAHSADGYEKVDMGRDVADVIRWPKKRLGRVVRGGSWDQPAARCRSAARLASNADWWEFDPDLPQSPWWLASDNSLTIGFRVIRPLNPPDPEDRYRYWKADCDEVKEDVADRVLEGRGVKGLVDPELPAAVERLKRD